MSEQAASGRPYRPAKQLSAPQQAQESAFRRAIGLDSMILIAFVASSLVSGSVTVLAEVLRGVFLFTIEVISYVTMWRSNRGKFVDFEYGIGKIERIVTILISGGLYFSALYTLVSAMGRLSEPVALPTTAMIFSVTVASVNLGINLYCTAAFILSNERESSLVMASQISARVVKTTASAIVVLVLVIATWLPDPKGATLIDALGGTLASAYMAWIATQLLRESLPDLMDRALPEEQQLLLLRVLTRYFDDFDQFDAVKSRRSGGLSFIDMDLAFEPDIPLHEVSRRCTAIERDIRELIPDARVTVTPHVAWADEAEAP